MLCKRIDLACTSGDVCISSHLLIASPVLNVCSNSSASVSLLYYTGLTGAFDNVTAEQAAGFLYMHLADTSVQYACASPGDMRSSFSSAWHSCKSMQTLMTPGTTNSCFLWVLTSLEWISRCIYILNCCTVSHFKGSCCTANRSTCSIGPHGKTALYNSSCFPNFLMPSSSNRIFPAKRPGMSCPGVQISVSVAVYDGATIDPVLYSYQGCNCVSGFLPHYTVDSVGKLLCSSSSTRS